MTEEQKKAHNAALDAGECPFVGVTWAGEALFCDRGAHHERHGRYNMDFHTAMTPNMCPVLWDGIPADRRRVRSR